LVVIVYFTYQYNRLSAEGGQAHLQEIAVNHSHTINLFLSERIANLESSLGDSDFYTKPTKEALDSQFRDLERTCLAFMDLGILDSSGFQTAYVGPLAGLEDHNYSSESWLRRLMSSDRNYIVSEISTAFTQRPYFTIAVKRLVGDETIVLRASLDAAWIQKTLRNRKDVPEVSTSIATKEGDYQVTSSHPGAPLNSPRFDPPLVPKIGVESLEIDGRPISYGYAWVQNADWALVTRWASEGPGLEGTIAPWNMAIFIASFVLLLIVIILYRAKKLVALQKETDRTRTQLEHAAKLASVGELAAGIAHEINNPLAVINEEAGLMIDLMDPEFTEPLDTGEMRSRLEIIRKSVFRCRDITHRLLKFVRKSDVELMPYELNQLIDSVVDGLLGRRLALANIELIRRYDRTPIAVRVDKNQMQQVFLNLLSNAIDAMKGNPGRITISSRLEGKNVHIAISDTGTGMTQDQMGKIFLPFYTTKEVGKGTGLGLAVSYGILKDLGGEISVESTLNVGSTFTISLPQHLST
jgi:two-component system NtrC family sensor kinase